MREGQVTRRHSHDHDARVMMPAAVTTSTDDDFLDADVGRTFRLELDAVAVQLDRVVKVRGDEDFRPRDSEQVRRVGSESHGRERSDHRNSDGRGSPPLLRTQYAKDLLRKITDEQNALHGVTSTSEWPGSWRMSRRWGSDAVSSSRVGVGCTPVLMVGQDVACRHHGALGSWSESRIEGCDWPAVCADSDDEATILAALDLALIEREREQEP